MARLAVLAIALAASLGLSACASGGGDGRRADTGASPPSASIRPGIEALAGRWEGALWETGSSLYQGTSRMQVRLDEDGTWQGHIGGAPAAGTARLEGNRLIVTGTTGAPGGPHLPVYVSLTGDEDRRWGQMSALFAGRRAPAIVSLQRLDREPQQAP
jgi:hypothetical protein